VLHLKSVGFNWVRVNQRICFPPNVFCFPLSAPPPALLTEAWRGAESGRRSAENVYVDLSRPVSILVHNFLFLFHFLLLKKISKRIFEHCQLQNGKWENNLLSSLPLPLSLSLSLQSPLSLSTKEQKWHNNTTTLLIM